MKLITVHIEFLDTVGYCYKTSFLLKMHVIDVLFIKNRNMLGYRNNASVVQRTDGATLCDASSKTSFE